MKAIDGEAEGCVLGYWSKVIQRIRQGLLRDIYRESRWIYGYAKKYRGAVFLFICLGLGSTAVGILSGLVSRNLINLVVGQATGWQLGTVACCYGALGIGKILLNAVSNRVSAHVNLNVKREMQKDVYERFINTQWRDISQYHTGDLMLRLDKDVSTVAGSVLGWIPSLITGLMQFFCALGVILYFDPIMALAALVGVPISTLLMGILTPKLRSWSQQVQQRSADINTFYVDSLQNLQTVKAFGVVERFSQNLDTLQEKYIEVGLGQNRAAVYSGVLMSFVGMAASYLCLGWGVYRLWTGKIDFGTMVLFIQLAGYLSSAASGLIKLGPGVVSATVSAERLISVLALPAERVEEPEELTSLNHSKSGITVSAEDVSFSYREGTPVLQHIDFVAQPGQVTAVVGPSGSGKTTLLRLFLSLVSPATGSTWLQGDNVRLGLQPGLRKLFSYVPQQKALFSGTVAETLRLGAPEATEEQLWEVLRLVEMDRVVEALPGGLHNKIGEDGALLSQGQGQRLSIARALLKDAPVMLLDEATSALDVETERRILDNIIEARRNATVIVTTHRPTVLTMCQRVYEIREGKATLLNEQEVSRRICAYGV